jgi:hypothetical protein
MQSNKNLKPTCPLKLGNLCDERCALYLEEEDSNDGVCAITLMAMDLAEHRRAENCALYACEVLQ